MDPNSSILRSPSCVLIFKTCFEITQRHPHRREAVPPPLPTQTAPSRLGRGKDEQYNRIAHRVIAIDVRPGSANHAE
eukprot:gene11839-biopygen8135